MFCTTLAIRLRLRDCDALGLTSLQRPKFCGEKMDATMNRRKKTLTTPEYRNSGKSRLTTTEIRWRTFEIGAGSSALLIDERRAFVIVIILTWLDLQWVCWIIWMSAADKVCGSWTGIFRGSISRDEYSMILAMCGSTTFLRKSWPVKNMYPTINRKNTPFSRNRVDSTCPDIARFTQTSTKCDRSLECNKKDKVLSTNGPDWDGVIVCANAKIGEKLSKVSIAARFLISSIESQNAGSSMVIFWAPAWNPSASLMAMTQSCISSGYWTLSTTSAGLPNFWASGLKWIMNTHSYTAL